MLQLELGLSTDLTLRISEPCPIRGEVNVANKIKVILNTYGGRLTAQTKTELVEKALHTAGLDYHLELTQYAGHAVELAQQAAGQGWPIIVAAGGDGTIHEVVNGLMQAAEKGRTATLGIIPRTPIQADGEIIDRTATEVNYSIITNKLRVIV